MLWPGHQGQVVSVRVTGESALAFPGSLALTVHLGYPTQTWRWTLHLNTTSPSPRGLFCAHAQSLSRV